MSERPIILKQSMGDLDYRWYGPPRDTESEATVDLAAIKSEADEYIAKETDRGRKLRVEPSSASGKRRTHNHGIKSDRIFNTVEEAQIYIAARREATATRRVSDL